MRLAVYTDYTYQRDSSGVYANRAFAVFLDELSKHFDGMTVVGRLEPGEESGRYRLGDRISFYAMPHYPKLTDVWEVAKAAVGSAQVFWKALSGVDAVWILGPHPYSFVFAALARLRRKRVVLGVRQDLPEYMTHRHPGSRSRILAAELLERAHRLLARRYPVIAVGAAIGTNYSKAKDTEVIAVSLARQESIEEPPAVADKDYSGDLTVLSVGRLEAEKNPLLLVEIIEALRQTEPRWRLVVCGEGDMEPKMRRLASDLGVSDYIDFRGYVPHDNGMDAIYRDAHFLLHVSWTEGLPQVLLEAMAACLPIVATDVGGIRGALGGAVRLVSPGEIDEPVSELRSLALDAKARDALIAEAHQRVLDMTLENETRRVAATIKKTS